MFLRRGAGAVLNQSIVLKDTQCRFVVFDLLKTVTEPLGMRRACPARSPHREGGSLGTSNVI
jgi:hypothetical protein